MASSRSKSKGAGGGDDVAMETSASSDAGALATLEEGAASAAMGKLAPEEVLASAPRVFQIARTASGVACIVFEYVRVNDLFRQAGYEQMRLYARERLGVEGEADYKKTARAGGTFWRYFPEKCMDVMRVVVGQGGDDRHPPALPQVPTKSAVALLPAALKHTLDAERPKLLSRVLEGECTYVELQGIAFAPKVSAGRPEASEPAPLPDSLVVPSALHGAGAALLAYMQGRSFGTVEVRAIPERQQDIEAEEFDLAPVAVLANWFSTPSDRYAAERDALLPIAGAVAASRDDIPRIKDSPELSRAAEILAPVSSSSRVCKKQIRLLIDVAADVIDDYGEAIEAIATELATRRDMLWNDIVRVLEEHQVPRLGAPTS